MLSMTDGYKAAIVGDVRQMFVKAVLDIIDPDIAYEVSSGSGEAPWSKSGQLYTKEKKLASNYVTLEANRWLLDGTFRLIPSNPAALTGQIGYVGNVISGKDGSFPEEVYAEIKFANVSILQACSICFSDVAIDGIGVDFRVAILSGETEVFSRNYTGNTKVQVGLDQFTVYDPTAIRVYVTKWSLPNRYMRMAQIIPGVYEEWTETTLASLDIQMRGNFSCLSIPYGTCVLRMDNLDRRFEPRNKTGVFQSIEERQGIPISIGVRLPDDTVEWKQVGVFYQFDGGWRTSDNAMTMQWELVDIVGLLSNREFVPDGALPTTLSGWMAALVAQLGGNFAEKWSVDPVYADAALTVSSIDDVRGKKCGDILRWACMASGTWPRADAKTGNLTAEPFWSEGNKYDLDNMTAYPTMKANAELAVLTFKLHDSAGTVYNISGNATSAAQTLTVNNPFIHTKEQALTAARQILSQYGGLQLELTGRGDPSSEIGDVDTVWLDESSATTGRRMMQQFGFRNGVMRDCRSVLLQADGSFLFENSVVLTGSGEWTPPAGVTQLRVIIGQAGQGSTAGADGASYKYESGWDPTPPYQAENGMPGAPGKVWHGTIMVNEGVPISYSVGKGSNAASYGETVQEGEESFFGVYSSANGHVYENGYTDIASGSSYGRANVVFPLDGTGDGAKAGSGGSNEVFRLSGYSTITDENGNVVGSEPVWAKVSSRSNGTPGAKGADGFIVVYWDKEAET